MDDDAGDWLSAAAEEPPPAPAPTPKKKKKDAGAKDAAEPETAADAPPAAEQKLEAEDEYLDPDKLLLFKHWIRPKFLPYRYLYDYRHNYYDDVIDYLNKRQCGLYRDIPLPQTWAERALRTYNSKINRIKTFKDVEEDTKLCTKIRLGCRFHIFHSKEYFNRRYSSILY